LLIREFVVVEQVVFQVLVYYVVFLLESVLCPLLKNFLSGDVVDDGIGV